MDRKMVFLFLGAMVFLFTVASLNQTPPQISSNKTALPQGVNQNWLSTVQKNIEKEEYNFSEAKMDSGALYQAANRANNFRVFFDEEGVKISPRESEKRLWKWGLELIEEGKAKVNKPQIIVEQNKIDYQRDRMTEWYKNDQNGVEQGFDIPKRINSNDETLQIKMKLKGDLRPVFSDDGQAVDFFDNGSVSVLRYSQLKATDSQGKILPSRFEAINGGIKIVVEDKNAIYPITVDPLATSPSWTAEGNQQYAAFGWSISTAGDVNGDGYSDVIIGAPNYENGETNEGRAFLYLGSAS
ncbi:MAG: integrin alpha, partial [Acidobacteriota bacterium]